MINGWEACNRYDEPQTDGLELYVYKISRSSGILLKQIQLPLSFIGHPSLLLEPFLIMFDGHDSWEVHNLLEPKKAPMTIKRTQWIIGDIDFGFWALLAGSKYESDIRQNGKLPESILFPVIYQPSARIVCVDCVDIRQSEIRTLWTQTVEFNNKIELDVIFIDRDNILLLAQLYNNDESQIYQSQDQIGPDMSFGIYEEMVVMYGSLDVDIVPKNIEEPQIKRISTRRIFDFINDESQEKLNVQAYFLRKEVTLPVVDLCK
ncbi:unnamed protein product [Oikopleura dioica]|uniref:Uncharacterized protein n=1 Tax=Oikopleura dioica TaxID=34765 RepID=E4Y9T7_OIKDI|nr:unnamed protein product [Oikopleura dioica]